MERSRDFPCVLLCVVQIFKFLIWMWRLEFSIDEISIVNLIHFQVKTFRPVSTQAQAKWGVRMPKSFGGAHIHMYTFIYIYIYIYIYVGLYIYVYIYVCIYIYVFIYIYIYVYIYMHIFMYLYVHKCMYEYIHMYIGVRRAARSCNVCIHTQISCAYYTWAHSRYR